MSRLLAILTDPHGDSLPRLLFTMAGFCVLMLLVTTLMVL
ncbi:MAG: hypothetical protein RL490_129 [Pseudomonadota bacterium]|jgi:hypothetical protein